MTAELVQMDERVRAFKECLQRSYRAARAYLTKVDDCDKDVTVEKVYSRIYGYLFCNQE
jgi:hypothetical protein